MIRAHRNNFFNYQDHGPNCGSRPRFTLELYKFHPGSGSYHCLQWRPINASNKAAADARLVELEAQQLPSDQGHRETDWKLVIR